jgi:hypothetical protein
MQSTIDLYHDIPSDIGSKMGISMEKSGLILEQLTRAQPTRRDMHVNGPSRINGKSVFLGTSMSAFSAFTEA